MPSAAEIYLKRIWNIFQGAGENSETGITVAKSLFVGERVATPGGASVEVDIPAGATSAIVTAEGGAGYFAINHTVASANSGGYVPEDINNLVLPISNWNSLHAYAGAGVTLHFNFYQD